MIPVGRITGIYNDAAPGLAYPDAASATAEKVQNTVAVLDTALARTTARSL